MLLRVDLPTMCKQIETSQPEYEKKGFHGQHVSTWEVERATPAEGWKWSRGIEGIGPIAHFLAIASNGTNG